jgi:hypothetical protein
MLNFNRPVSYSSVLIDFIHPLLTGDESDDEFLQKARIGQIAWNFAVSDKAGLATDDKMKEVLKGITGQYPDARETLNTLVMRKHDFFFDYDQIILTVEKREKPDGNTTLYVESAPASVLKDLGG